MTTSDSLVVDPTDAAAIQRQFRETGVVVFEKFYSDATLDPIRDALEAHFAPLAADAIEMTAG